MESFVTSLFKQLSELNPLDLLAFVFSIGYVVLISKKMILGWLFAILSSSIYVFLCFSAKLYLDSFLQLFYVYMAVWGWIKWKKAAQDEMPIQIGTIKLNLIYIAIGIGISFILGFIFKNFTDQAFPYMDAFIMVFSMLATFLVGKRYLENWIYFIVIDALAVPIYWNRELYLMSILFVIYVVLAIVGYNSWKKTLYGA